VIHVDAIEPNDQTWKDWRAAAEEATSRMTSAADIDDRMYKGGQQKILDLFHGKCAYCEAKIVADQIKGDVEHFRPKGRVRDKDGNVVFVDATTPHPGYFWLAYDWTNLLPACIMCNRPHRNSAGETVGKSDMFPLSDESKRARKRGDDVGKEQPLLLNPYDPKVDLKQHLKFDADLGTVSGLTPEGSETVYRLDLNREGLVDERRARAAAAEDAYNAYVDASRADAPKKPVKLAAVKDFLSGASPYSAIARIAIARVKAKLVDAIENAG
jgi:hypothetical protein